VEKSEMTHLLNYLPFLLHFYRKNVQGNHIVASNSFGGGNPQSGVEENCLKVSLF
jgi:hypothetical protein